MKTARTNDERTNARTTNERTSEQNKSACDEQLQQLHDPDAPSNTSF